MPGAVVSVAEEAGSAHGPCSHRRIQLSSLPFDFRGWAQAIRRIDFVGCLAQGVDPAPDA